MPIPNTPVNINRAEAEEILAKKKPGDYIFRASSKNSPTGTVGVISCKNEDNEINHFWVKKSADNKLIATDDKGKTWDAKKFKKFTSKFKCINTEIIHPHIDTEIDLLFKDIHKPKKVMDAIMKAKNAGKILLTHLYQELKQIDKQDLTMRAKRKELSTQYEKVEQCLDTLSEAAKESTPRNVKTVTEEVGKTEKAFKYAPKEKQSLLKKFCKCALIAVATVLTVGIPVLLWMAADNEILRRKQEEINLGAAALKEEINDPNSSISKNIKMVDDFIDKTNRVMVPLQTQNAPAQTQQQTQTIDPPHEPERGFGPVGPGRH